MDDASSSYLGQRRRHGSGMQALWRALPSPSIGWGPRQPPMRTNPLYLAFFSAGSEPHWWPFFSGKSNGRHTKNRAFIIIQITFFLF